MIIAIALTEHAVAVAKAETTKNINKKTDTPVSVFSFLVRTLRSVKTKSLAPIKVYRLVQVHLMYNVIVKNN